MTWFKVDDGLHSHRKVRSIPRKDRPAAMGLWVLAGSWCADNLTDGRVPGYMVGELGCHPRLAEALVTADLWSTDGDGWCFKGWGKPGRTPSRAEIEKQRQDWRDRQQRSRSRSDTPSDSDSDTPSDSRGESRTVSPRPVPVPVPSPSSGLGSQSPNGRSDLAPIDRLDFTKIARLIGAGADEQWARRAGTQILDRAPADVRDPQRYVEAAIRERPADYRQRPTPPRKDELCDEHGRARATCPSGWHE